MHGPTVVRLSGRGIGSPCLVRTALTFAARTLHRSSIHTKRKLHGTIVPDENVQKNMIIQSQPSFQNYFSANETIDRGWVRNGWLAAFRTAGQTENKMDKTCTQAGLASQNGLAPDIEATAASKNHHSTAVSAVGNEGTQAAQSDATATAAAALDAVLPHRRRHLRKAMLETEKSQRNGVSDKEEQLPFDASAQLASAATAMPPSAVLRRRLATYLSLTKPRLSFLIILTTTSAYSLYPISGLLSSAAHAVDASSTLSTSTLTLAFLSVGTFLSCASANTFNMLFEPKYDALMTRTRNRPLVRNLISRKAALLFGVVCGVGGVLMLYFGTNPTVAGLSAMNIVLYAGIYTPMKRLSPWNTWVGAIVGGIPPLMGWCAAAGETATAENHSWHDLLLSESSTGGWLLAALLFAWQFPHFNSLSYTIRDDYRNAGHRMLAWMNPARNARVALRYSIAMFPICAGLYWVGVVNEGFIALSTACNVWMTKEAIAFYKKQGAGGSARGLFWASVWQLPLVLVGALLCKKGIWDGFFGEDTQAMNSDGSSGSDALVDDDLGMESALAEAIRPPPTINMAMMGFKRPS